MSVMQSIEEYEKIPIKEREEMARERLRQGKSVAVFVSDEEIEEFKELQKKLKQKNEDDNEKTKL